MSSVVKGKHVIWRERPRMVSPYGLVRLLTALLFALTVPVDAFAQATPSIRNGVRVDIIGAFRATLGKRSSAQRSQSDF